MPNINNIFVALLIVLATSLGLYGRRPVLGTVAYKSHKNTDDILDAIEAIEATTYI